MLAFVVVYFMIILKFFPSSFAFKTLSLRLPIIITKVIDLLCRERKTLPRSLNIPQQDLVNAEEETKKIIEELAKLKYELQTNKPMTPFTSDLPETSIWNDFLKELGSEPCWFDVCWLYAECYLYRRMREIFYLSTYFKNLDPFEGIKEQAFISAANEITILASQLADVDNQIRSGKSVQSLFVQFIMVTRLEFVSKKTYSVFYSFLCLAINVISPFRVGKIRTSLT